MSLLEVKDLTIRFGGLVAVDNLSFTMEEGQVTSLIGPNGAGKTTVINLLTGFYTPNEGQVILDGEDITGNPTDVVVEKGLSRTFQNIRLFSNMSVEDNVLIGMQHRIGYGSFLSLFPNPKKNFWEKKAREEVGQILERVDLSEYRFDRSTSLPYGKQRKLEIGRALAAQPKILLLDEPAAGMNPQETQELADYIREIRDTHNLTIFLIEHHMDLVMKISDYIYVIDFGSEIARGVPKEVQQNKRVIEAYLGVTEDE